MGPLEAGRDAWQSSRRVLVRLGFGPLLLRIGILGLAETRRLLAARHLRGVGLEIGAPHFPLPVPPGVTVRYVDKFTANETRLRSAEFRSRTLAHHIEYLEIAAPNIARERGEPPPARSREQLVAEAEGLAALETDIHYHTFSVSSFRRLAGAFATEICPFMRVVEVVRSRLEVIGILRRVA